MPDGSLCPKCRDVLELLEKRGLRDRIDRIVPAAPKEPDGEGMRLVRRHRMKRAPFFVVEGEDGTETVYASVLQMIGELFPDKEKRP